METTERKLFERAIEAFERQAVANESLLKIAESEQFIMENGPPVCPNCGKLNPEVTQLVREGAGGPISEFVMEAETHCCNRTVYCMATGWEMTTHLELVQELMESKKGGNNASA